MIVDFWRKSQIDNSAALAEIMNGKSIQLGLMEQ